MKKNMKKAKTTKKLNLKAVRTGIKAGEEYPQRKTKEFV